VGGVLGGAMLGQFNESGVYLLVCVVCLLWLYVAKSMARPSNETGMTLQFSKLNNEIAQTVSDKLSEVAGVEDVVVIPKDGIAYLKVNKLQLNYQQLDDVMDCFKEA